MDFNKLHKIIAAFVFLIALVVFISTAQVSVSFWDCGEFIASAVLLQVPHPPGTPFFLILGRLFSVIPFAEDLAFRVNMLSVVSSAFTVLFAYLIIVKLINIFKKNEKEGLLDKLGTYLAAATGSLSLAFADTFWFNAVEAEVYALSTFFIGIVTWLIMVWNEKADEEDNSKYLILIAYLIGLSSGVHLLAVLASVSIVMVVIFRKYVDDFENLKKTGILLAIHGGIILLLLMALWAGQTHSSPVGYEEAADFDWRVLMISGTVSVVFVLFFRKQIFSKNSFYLPMLIGSLVLLSIYPGIVKHIPNLIATIGKNNLVIDIAVIVAILGITGYIIYYSRKNNKHTLNLLAKCFLFAFIGFSSYSMIIIRSNQDTPINLNSPKTFSELVSYLNREQYGDAPLFQRRYSMEPQHQAIYRNYSSDLDFFWNYQMDHMFNRYMLWNYAGRASTMQDDGVDWSKLLGIPFFLGLFGIFYHFRRDWKMASVFLVLFLMLGYIMSIYFNMQQPQPRERDYFYAGALFVFSIWIGLGVRGTLDFVREKFFNTKFLKPILSLVMIVAFVAVPVNMLSKNYFSNDRSKNYLPWDYAYNLLQSVAPNGIIFTNGDNDTFPLWYLQDVEGVRHDVRVVNLSLLNTPWYILQMKNTEPHGAQKIKMSYSDDQINRIGPARWETRTISIDVPPEVIEQYNVTDTSIINSGKLSWRMSHAAQYGDITAVRVQDLVALDIIRSNVWDRPIYFAATVSDDSKIGLLDYLQMEGMAYRLIPDKKETSITNVNPEIIEQQLFNIPEGHSKTYQPGFKFRGMDDPSVFLNDGEIRMMQNYRNSFIKLALYYLYETRDNEKVIRTLDKMEERLPRHVLPIDHRILFDVANIYYEAEDFEKYVEISSEVQEITEQKLKENPTDFQSSYNPYRLLLDIYERTGQYGKAVELVDQIESYLPGDPSVQSLRRKFERLSKSQEDIETDKNIPVPDIIQ